MGFFDFRQYTSQSLLSLRDQRSICSNGTSQRRLYCCRSPEKYRTGSFRFLLGKIMPKKIILVRHGETDFNVAKIIQGQLDTFLNQQGLKQAVDIACVLAQEHIDLIFSSDLKRAHHTACIIGEKAGKPVVTTRHLRERHFGSLQGLTRREIVRFIPGFGEEGRWTGGWFDSILGIETDVMMEKRIGYFIEEDVQQHKNKTVVFVTHGGTIRMILKVFGFDEVLVKNLNIKNTSCITLIKRHVVK